MVAGTSCSISRGCEVSAAIDSPVHRSSGPAGFWCDERLQEIPRIHLLPGCRRGESAGSEVAHRGKLDADHRPPLKRGVRFSRATLSRRLSVLRGNRRNQFDQLHQPILAVQFAFRQLFPTAVAPTLIPMRPNASLDPMVEFVEERSDVGTFVIVPPSPQNWI